MNADCRATRKMAVRFLLGACIILTFPSAKSQENVASEIAIYSVPARMSVYLSTEDDAAKLFTAQNLNGSAPVRLKVQRGTYYVGFRQTIPAASRRRFAVVQTFPNFTGGGIVSSERASVTTFTKGKLLLRRGPTAATTMLALEETNAAVDANRTRLLPDEEEPYLWDYDGSEFNSFVFTIRESVITEVGTIYRVRADAPNVECVGYVLSSAYRPSSLQLSQLGRLYPQGKQSTVKQAPEETRRQFQELAIPYTLVGSILDLLERGGKLIFTGKLEGSLTVKKGQTIPILFANTPEETKNTEVRHVLPLVDGAVRVATYGRALPPSEGK